MRFEKSSPTLELFAPDSILEGVHALEPGCWLRYRLDEEGVELRLAAAKKKADDDQAAGQESEAAAAVEATENTADNNCQISCSNY